MANQEASATFEVGLYLDMRNPQRWRRDAVEHYATTLKLCEEADELGIHSLWFTEHHLFEDDYLPQPLTFAAAVAARTATCRLGTSVLIAPFRSAVNIAEEAAIVDVLSGGRLELGLGAGYSLREFELFEASHSDRWATTRRRVAEVRELWRSGHLTPSPAQDEIPIWVGAAGKRNAADIGQLGVGLLRVDRELVESYVGGLSSRGHDRRFARMAGPVNVFLSDDPERDWPVIRPHVAYQWESYATSGTPIGAELQLEIADRRRAMGLREGSMAGFLLATPEEAASEIRNLVRGTPTSCVYLWATLPGLPVEMARCNVQLACTRLRECLAAQN